MEILREFEQLTKKQQTALCKKLVSLKKHAVPADNDSYIMQVVCTMYGKHWFGLIYQTIDNVVDGNWSLSVSSIKEMVVDVVHEDDNMCSNVVAEAVKMNDGSYVIISDLINTSIEGDEDADNID